MRLFRKTVKPRLDEAVLKLLDTAGITLPDGSRWVRPEWMERNLVAAPLTLKADGTPAYGLCYFEGPKGCAKTFCTVMVHLAEALVHGDTLVVIAGRDRAAIQPDVDFLSGAIRRSPLLRRRCQVLTDAIRLEGDSRIEFWPADERGVHGSGGAFARFRVILEDPHAWAAYELMDSMLATSGKTANTRVTVCTNPGPRRSGRLWSLRSQARKRQGKDAWAWMPWSDGGKPPEVPWITPEWRERMQAVLPDPVFNRFILGSWDESTSFVTREAVAACVGTHTTTRRSPGRAYLGLDVGLRRHHTGEAWGHAGDGVFILDGYRRWDPAMLGGEVQLADVVEDIRDLARGYDGATLLADPFQAIYALQTLRGEMEVIEFSFSVPNQCKLAQALFEGLKGRLIRLPGDCMELVEELASLETVPSGFGFRFEFAGEGTSHGDVAVALALAYFGAVQRGLVVVSLADLIAQCHVGGQRLSSPAPVGVAVSPRPAESTSWFDKVQEQADIEAGRLRRSAHFDW